MTISELFNTLRRHLILVILLPVLGLICAGFKSATTTPEYRATTSVYFSLSYGNSAVDLSQGSSYTQAQMESYATLAKSPRVLRDVARKLPFDTTVARLTQEVSTSSAAGTVIIRISAMDPSAQRAAAIANSTANSLRQTARELSPKDSAGNPTVDVTTIGSAKVPSAPSIPSVKRDLAMGLLAGLILGVALAMVREKLDLRIRSAEDLPASNVPVLGSVALARGRDTVNIAVRDAPTSFSAEQFRRLQTSLQFVRSNDEPMTLTITSSGADEGKSTMALNLACAYAESGERVLLLDADMRRPSIAHKFGIEDAVGLSTVLSGRASLDEVVQRVGGDEGLDVLPSGVLPPNPVQLLGSTAMRDLVEKARVAYDVVIVDSPPLLAVADAALISALTSGTILIVRAGQASVRDVQESVEALTQVNAPLVGMVLSRRMRRRQLPGPYAADTSSARSWRILQRRTTRHATARQRRHNRSTLTRRSEQVGDGA